MLCSVVHYDNDHTQLRGVMIPDVDPYSLPPNAPFSMAAGDFLEVYTEPGLWDVIACAFFLDTARNIIAYFESMYKILKPGDALDQLDTCSPNTPTGGHIINLGPLLYHFDDNREAPSIELSWVAVKGVIQGIGFVIEVCMFARIGVMLYVTSGGNLPRAVHVHSRRR